ncbi:hypothetical protein C8Q76DRAFT_370586 [Earliella scabrosa]|nr:hypothetical protein C8Q76DRAFT_370586 [Earliella scabrosa]
MHMSSIFDNAPTVLAAAASSIHADAWGRKWPKSSEGTIHLSDLKSPRRPTTCAHPTNPSDDAINEEAGANIAEAVEGVVPSNEEIEEEDIAKGIPGVEQALTYDCLKGMQAVMRLLCVSIGIKDCLIVRDDYPYLLKELEELVSDGTRAVVITGQPGIGKTVFLLYLFFYRLERQLPTAIQLDTRYYFIFDEQGVTAHYANGICTLVDRGRLERCWALSDSVASVEPPCGDFGAFAAFVVHASSPRWRRWLAQMGGVSLGMELPTVLEIGAVVKESGYDTWPTYDYVATWGPSIRTILDIVGHSKKGAEGRARDEAKRAAAKICGNPRNIMIDDMLTHQLVFQRPQYDEKGERCPSLRPFIPTDYLASILEERLAGSSTNAKFLELFDLLSSHAYTRTGAGWMLEREMHARLLTGANPLQIARRAGDIVEKRALKPTHKRLPSTLAALKTVGVSDVFYWMPLASNFPGIDAVLGDGSGYIYALQATLTSDHCSPVDGLRLLRKSLHPEVRKERPLHVVVVADTQTTADALVAQFTTDLQAQWTQGRVGVWSCVWDGDDTP